MEVLSIDVELVDKSRVLWSAAAADSLEAVLGRHADAAKAAVAHVAAAAARLGGAGDDGGGDVNLRGFFYCNRAACAPYMTWGALHARAQHVQVWAATPCVVHVTLARNLHFYAKHPQVLQQVMPALAASVRGDPAALLAHALAVWGVVVAAENKAGGGAGPPTLALTTAPGSSSGSSGGGGEDNDAAATGRVLACFPPVGGGRSDAEDHADGSALPRPHAEGGGAEAELSSHLLVERLLGVEVHHDHGVYKNTAPESCAAADLIRRVVQTFSHAQPPHDCAWTLYDVESAHRPAAGAGGDHHSALARLGASGGGGGAAATAEEEEAARGILLPSTSLREVARGDGRCRLRLRADEARVVSFTYPDAAGCPPTNMGLLSRRYTNPQLLAVARAQLPARERTKLQGPAHLVNAAAAASSSSSSSRRGLLALGGGRRRSPDNGRGPLELEVRLAAPGGAHCARCSREKGSSSSAPCRCDDDDEKEEEAEYSCSGWSGAGTSCCTKSCKRCAPPCGPGAQCPPWLCAAKCALALARLECTCDKKCLSTPAVVRFGRTWRTVVLRRPRGQALRGQNVIQEAVYQFQLDAGHFSYFLTWATDTGDGAYEGDGLPRLRDRRRSRKRPPPCEIGENDIIVDSDLPRGHVLRFELRRTQPCGPKWQPAALAIALALVFTALVILCVHAYGYAQLNDMMLTPSGPGGELVITNAGGGAYPGSGRPDDIALNPTDISDDYAARRSRGDLGCVHEVAAYCLPCEPCTFF